jgi:hypothetical protein
MTSPTGVRGPGFERPCQIRGRVELCKALPKHGIVEVKADSDACRQGDVASLSDPLTNLPVGIVKGTGSNNKSNPPTICFLGTDRIVWIKDDLANIIWLRRYRLMHGAGHMYEPVKI